ncbi:galactokinase [Corynebacterium accolens]|uniref:galactokinase n=1 Tax=Corynebacterium TaxID=1716 RepID=UPI0003B802D9|nr:MULTISPECIES: galactokinase [Corynebacterium]ERS61406.1 galactokinase [Corynebacterium sp. KPL1818]MDK4209317.1 galactokinase [Corynebacterium accolens]MDK4233104.1 galactokinase [Corynebacterium accolens]
MPKWFTTRTDEELATAARRLFMATFAEDEASAAGPEPVGVWAAPGRVNLIGEHIDYAGGASIPFALEQNTAVAVRPRTDGVIRIASEFDGSVAQACVPLSSVRPRHPADWSGYVAGTIWAAVEADLLQCDGLDIAIVSDVPVGSGLSSSAALECSIAVAAYELDHGHLPDDVARAGLVEACIRAENEVVGASTGGLDQNASLFGQRGKALFLDFSTGAVERIPFDIASQDLVLLIADTNAPHMLSDGQYASRRGIIDDVQSAAGCTIRDIPDAVDFAATVAEKSSDSAELYQRRVRHVVEETERTLSAASALCASDMDTFRQLMRDSHVSLRDFYEVTTPELDSAFNAAGELGARMTGGGFGGAVIALIAKDDVDATAQAIEEAAAQQGFPAPTFVVARPGEGARRLH